MRFRVWGFRVWVSRFGDFGIFGGFRIGGFGGFLASGYRGYVEVVYGYKGFFVGLYRDYWGMEKKMKTGIGHCPWSTGFWTYLNPKVGEIIAP